MKSDGIEIGLKEGQKRKQNEIVKKMLKKGMDVEIISKIIGMSLDEVKKLN